MDIWLVRRLSYCCYRVVALGFIQTGCQQRSSRNILLKQFLCPFFIHTAPTISDLPTVCVEFNLNGLNLFFTANSFCLMSRVDSVHITAPSPAADIAFSLYNVAFDQVCYHSITNSVQCYSVAGLPAGGFGYLQQISIAKTNTVLLNLHSYK